MSLELYCGALGIFDLDVDDATTAEVDDLSAVTWTFRLLGADNETLELTGVYDQPTVTVECPAATSATIAPGLYLWHLVAAQTGLDDIVAGEGVLVVKSYLTDVS